MGLSIFQQIKDIDQALFYQINGVWHYPILGWLIYQVGWKTLKWLLFALMNVGLTDQISSSVFKPYFHRLRPCNDPALFGKTRLLLEHCAGGFSFTSSHAANHFGIAMFIFMTWGGTQKKYTRFFFVWAGVIAFAQIYVGVHYPLDIVGGTIIGLISGYTMAKAYLKWAGPMELK
jgi:undecaprenyl-diphosphatase